MEQKEKDLLPVPYFHVVFTLPHELADVPTLARSALYEALFRAAAETLLAVGRRRLGGEVGFLSVLHTWGQTLTHHPHVHCVVAGGALSEGRAAFTKTGARFLLPVQVLRLVFKAKMIAELRRRPPPGIAPSRLALLLAHVATKKWVVYAKRPFGGPAQVLRYLARYTHKIAITDHRIVHVDAAGVTFRYKDYKHESASKTMCLRGNEWLRRFTTHVLPRGFVRLRSFGFLANAHKGAKLAAIRMLLNVPAPNPPHDDERPTCTCPICRQGALLERRPLVSMWTDTS